MIVAELLTRVTEALSASGVPYMVGGSFASTKHGLPRSTLDIDLIIAPPEAASFEALVEVCCKGAYYCDREVATRAYRDRGMFNVIDHATGWKVDFILCKSRPFSREEFQRRTPASMFGVPVWVATAEDTIISKLEWSKNSGGSARQRRDVAGIVAVAGSQLDHGYLQRWLAALDLGDEWRAANEATTD